LASSKRETVLQAFHAGARGIFSRHDSVESLSKCIRSVYEGQVWATGEQVSFAVEALACSPVVRAVDANGLSLLSKRELDVVRSLAEGLTNREIAERLGLSQHTIKNYLFRVYDKLGVSSRLELLFMTLTQAGAPRSAAQNISRVPRNPQGLGRSDRAKGRLSRPSVDGGKPELGFSVPPSSVRKDVKREESDEFGEAKSRSDVVSFGTDPLD